MSYIHKTLGTSAHISVTVSFLLAIAVILAAAIAAGAQKVPENGEKIPLGSKVIAPCSCVGNLCDLWPPPASATYPEGFKTKMTKITSFIEEVEMIEGNWSRSKGIGGSAITEQYQGGKCVVVDGGGGRSDQPGPGIFTITRPGVYRLKISKFEWDAIYDCRQAQCSYSNPHVLRSDHSEELRFFTVEEPPDKGCGDRGIGLISSVTEYPPADGGPDELTKSQKDAMGLGRRQFYRGQTVTIPKSMRAVEIKFEDGSVMRLNGGTSMKTSKCDDLLDPSRSFKGTILIGKVWTQTSPGSADKVTLDTPGADTGALGTTYSVEYTPATKTTTVTVEDGTVWLRNKLGPKKTLTINPGQTATQTATQPPRLKP